MPILLLILQNALQNHPISIAVTLLLPIIVAAVWRALSSHRPKSSLPLPPGPPAEPILGHLRAIPTDNPEYAYQAWSREYKSDIISFQVLGQPIVVLNSLKAASDLLDRRGANYADRPRFVLFEEMGWKATLTFLRWGPRFRAHRRVLQRAFQKTSIAAYRSLQEREVAVMLNGITTQPTEWETLLRRCATAIILGISFGIDIQTDTDPFIQMATDASYALGHGGAPAGTLVDFFPFARYIPTWLLRDRSLIFARSWKWAIRQIHDAPFATVINGKAGNGVTSLTQTLLDRRQGQLESGERPDLDEEDIKGAAGAVYAAGQDTTWATTVTFILNMVLNPEVQAKAQAALDAVLADENGVITRLPTFEDRPKLRYIDYIVQETLRWCPVSPVGVPHRALNDDEYAGYKIPAGAFVYANARAITHDERIYHNPDAFDPDRYTPVEEGGRGEPFPVGQFGFGRRICVGKHLAEASVWIVVARMLATMNIKKAAGADGKEITPQVELTNGLTSHPKSFPCMIRPRNPKMAYLIQRAAEVPHKTRPFHIYR